MMSIEPVTTEYVVGLLHVIQGRRGRGGFTNHIGIVDHYYGPFEELAYVRTLCGRTGRMNGKGLPQPDLNRAECGTCLRVWEKRSGKET